MSRPFALGLALLVTGCGSDGGGDAGASREQAAASTGQHVQSGEQTSAPALSKPRHEISTADTLGLASAIFAGGCFWCVETAFEDVPGVRAAISGYVGGEEPDPTYEEVSSGRTGHAEAVLVTFDESAVSFETLLEIFWVNHDPTTPDRQFCDRGHQYRPGIFYLDDAQRSAAEASVAWADEHRRVEGRIVTEITKAGTFWPAEEYHQDYYLKEPARYRSYRRGCRRDPRLQAIWGDLSGEHP